MKEKEQEKKKSKYDVHMTDEEKNRVWDGVLRRSTDFPDGKSPYADKPSNWDGTLRRATDFNDGTVPSSVAIDAKDEEKEEEKEDQKH